MGLSRRAYARHRGVSLTAVQKALKAGRIRVLADDTIDPVAADAAWTRAAEAGTDNGTTPADATRVVLPAGSLATAETLVRAVLAEHGAPAGAVLTMRDGRLANELLRARQRAEAIRAERARVRYMTGVDLEAEDDAAREEAIGWWRWSDATAATLAQALGVREARVVAVLAPAMRARLEALGLVGDDDDEEDDEDADDDEHDREEDEDQEDEDDVEPLRAEDAPADQDEETVAADDAGAEDQADAAALDPDSPSTMHDGLEAAAVAPAGAVAADLEPADEELEEADDRGDVERAAPVPVPEPAAVPSPGAATAADSTASPTPPPAVVPLPGTQPAVVWRRSSYWSGPTRRDRNDR